MIQYRKLEIDDGKNAVVDCVGLRQLWKISILVKISIGLTVADDGSHSQSIKTAVAIELFLFVVAIGNRVLEKLWKTISFILV